MANSKTFYEILNVSEDSSLMDIKSHYHKLARLYHPDITKLTNTHDKFIEINEAYRTLKDPILRKAYDFGLKQKRVGNKGVTEEIRAGAVNDSDVKKDTGSKQETKTEYKAKTTKELANISALSKQAFSCFASQNYNEAIRCADEVIAVDEANFDMWKLKGDVYYQIKNYDLSMEAYSKACRIKDTPEIRSLLSGVIIERNKYLEANRNSGKKKKRGGFFG